MAQNSISVRIGNVHYGVYLCLIATLSFTTLIQFISSSMVHGTGRITKKDNPHFIQYKLYQTFYLVNIVHF